MQLLMEYTLLYSIVLMLVALGGMFSERSGIINLALEGIMVIGGLSGVLTAHAMGNAAPVIIVAASVSAAGLAGILYSLLLAFACIRLKADQNIGGTALNILATAIAMVVAKSLNHVPSSSIAFQNAPFLFDADGITLNVFLIPGILLLIASHILLYKTRLGLRLRASGEHPQAAVAAGISVSKICYTSVIFSGLLSGIGGLACIMPAAQSWHVETGVAGMGFLALAVMIFGQWKPLRIFFAALFFSLFCAVAATADAIPFLAALNWPRDIYRMVPFIASLLILACTGKNARAPKARGIPFDRDMR